MAEGPLTAVLLLLALCLPLVALARRLRVGALAAYLLTGVAVGLISRFTPGFHHLGHDELRPFAEAGASMLLFGIGLELELGGLRSRLVPILVGGIGQIGLTVAAGALVTSLIGLPWQEAVAIGCCLAMTSTLFLLRGLEEHGLRHRVEGQVVIGLSLLQDLALAPMLVLIALAVPGAKHAPLWQIAAGLTLFILLTVLARKILAGVLISRLRSLQAPELEVAFAVLAALGAALVADRLGLGAAVGAFSAGLALGGDSRVGVETAVRPLQGLLAIVFFASMGMLFDPIFVWRNLGLVLAATAISLVVKSLLAALALRLARLSWRSALGGGIITGSIGEFAFVLAAAAFGDSQDARIRDLYQLVVAVSCLGLLSTPLLVRLAVPLLPRSPLERITDHGDTIVVAGLGPVGNTVVQALRERGHPLLLVDRNPRLLAPWMDVPGIRCKVGKIEDMDDWLPHLGHRPAMVLLTFPVADTSALVATRLGILDPDLPIVARSPYQAQVDFLHASGVRHVICDETATAAALAPLLDEVLNEARQRSGRLVPTQATLHLVPSPVDKPDGA